MVSTVTVLSFKFSRIGAVVPFLRVIGASVVVLPAVECEDDLPIYLKKNGIG